MPTGKFVTLASSATLPEARQAAQRLKASGIPAYIRGEAAALIAADPAHAVVQLEVAEEDVEHAARVLAMRPGSEASRPVDPNVKPPPTGETVEETADPDADSLTTVEVFHDPIEAMHAAGLLRARGIDCHLSGWSEGILPGLYSGITTIRLGVRESDLERAYEILGFTVDDGESNTGAVPDESAPRSDHIQEVEPRSSRKVKQPPFVQPVSEATPAETTSAPADDLAPPPAAPLLEAGSGGPDIGLILLLWLVGGSALFTMVWLLFGRA